MDLIDLFIGHEGTLGVVTEMELVLVPALLEIMAGVAFFPRKELAWDFVHEAKAVTLKNRSGENDALEAISLEYFDRNALELLKEDYPHVPGFADAAIFFEQLLDGKNMNTVLDQWTVLLEKYKSPLERVWFSNNTRDQQAFREFRHRLPERVNERVRKNGFPKTGTDIAVPDEAFPEMLKYYYEVMDASRMEHLMFGHIGECHMHANFLPSSAEEFAESKRLYELLVDKALSLGGTVSAEHGIGKLKHLFLEKMVGEQGIREMAEIKKNLDPALILGRGNLFPPHYLNG